MSPLENDLASDSHDALYRAASFIARHGGPPLPARVDDFGALALARHAMQRWLAAHPDRIALDDVYRRYVEHWSPVFKD